MGRRNRNLSAEDKALWDKVVDGAHPLHPARRALVPHIPHEPPAQPAGIRAPMVHPAISPFQLGQRSRSTAPVHDLAPELRETIHGAPLRMDQKSFARMKRCKLRPEGKLDLHGMTLAAAHPAMIRFVMEAHAAGKRLVLVVTGKGKSGQDHGPIPVRQGVLKHQVPQWLAMPPVGAVVLQVTPAHISHGGEGAYYVYLRRAR
jgi:DNA-nicking Smr family endonuclease